MIPVGIPGEIWAWLALTALALMLMVQIRLASAAREARRVANWRRDHRTRAAR